VSDISELFIAAYGRDDEAGTKIVFINVASSQGYECQIVFRRSGSFNGIEWWYDRIPRYYKLV